MVDGSTGRHRPIQDHNLRTRDEHIRRGQVGVDRDLDKILLTDIDAPRIEVPQDSPTVLSTEVRPFRADQPVQSDVDILAHAVKRKPTAMSVNELKRPDPRPNSPEHLIQIRQRLFAGIPGGSSLNHRQERFPMGLCRDNGEVFGEAGDWPHHRKTWICTHPRVNAKSGSEVAFYPPA